MRKTIRKGNAIILIFVVMFSLTSCLSMKTDEELIADKVNDFIFAYNNGDMEGAIECFDTKSKKTLNATMNIGESIFSGIVGFDISLDDLFSIGMGFMTDDPLSMGIKDIEITSDNTATVVLDVTFSEESLDVDESAENVVLHMVKEKGNWYIDMREELSNLMK